MGRITKYERRAIIRDVLIGVGTFLAVFSIQEWLTKTFSPLVLTAIGITFIFLALLKFNVK